MIARESVAVLLVVVVSSVSMIGWSYFQGEESQPETMKLVPMMQLLLNDMQTVDQGIYTEDYEVIAQGAAGIAHHPVMTPEDKAMVKKVLGKEIKQFVAFDKTVHHHADSMRKAAVEQNMEEVLTHYRIVQQGCVDCHSNYRKQISAVNK
ncbi:cytochrome c [Fodinibius halophilus]|uniref:Cytochrome c n=1 Tax=Fodinibius halophilus TaxID=1736908 RepID=A0A6M1T3U3_9BACT|nr:cytochrome c [Fodinibius halophilus]NGP88759.1 cytochrome c [Fodinibius halophilus]